MKKLSLPIIPSFIQPIPLTPFTTIENPRVAPTILCVPETGNLKKVATNSHRQEPKILYELKHVVLDYPPPPPPPQKKKKKKVSIVKAIMIKCKFNSIIYFGHRKRVVIVVVVLFYFIRNTLFNVQDRQLPRLNMVEVNRICIVWFWDILFLCSITMITFS